jgi:hypothetical protein|uniref:Benzoxazinone synthesis11 n=1 Tax=Zea mays TaxID=4577 RepID=A0A804MK97_MAIZE
MALMQESSQDLLEAHDELFHHCLCFAKSLALAVAQDLRIPDAIHHHGGGATLHQILAEAALHPSKLRALRRLMRVLTVSGVFTVQYSSTVDASDGADVVYRLTAASRFLVSDSDEAGTASLAPFANLALHPIAISPHAVGICAWFRQEQHDPSPYGLAFRQIPTIWEHADNVNALLNKGLLAESRFLMPIVLRECGDEVFRGIDSLVDVGGGHGGAAATIAAAFPHVKCSVLDLPHVVAGAPSDACVQFVAGNMFHSIPPATAVFFKVPSNPLHALHAADRLPDNSID